MQTLSGQMGQARSEGAGPSVQVVVNQGSTDPGGWTLDLYACTSDGDGSQIFVKSVTVAAAGPTVQPCRLLMLATIPMANRYVVRWSAPSPAPAEPIELGIFCSLGTAFAPIVVST